MSTLRDINVVLSVHDEYDVTARKLWFTSKPLTIAMEIARILKGEQSSLLEGSYVVTKTRYGYEHRLHIVLPAYYGDVDIIVLSPLSILSLGELESLFKPAVEQVAEALRGETLPPAGRKIGGPIIQVTESITGGQR